MDKNSIKKFAVWARRELISRVSQRAYQYGITEDSIVPGDAASVNGVVLSADEIRQRKALIDQINAKDYRQVMEEVAYTWFNRFIALRFMEVNSYLPSRVRVFTDADNRFKPQILTEAIDLELDGLDIDRVFALKDANDDEALFKYLLITQCNALSAVLPGMFQRISDYTELLFPDNLLRDGSVVEQMIAMIPQEDWTEQVQIIGWLYQYYNSEKKDAVFAALKKNIKITKENIPAATQLFTPDWIVRYMVENSLGRLWVEGHPDEELKSEWKYYLEEAEQEPAVQKQLAEIRREYAAMTPEDIKCIDPCMGSGHILAYLFDVLMQIYQTSGYGKQEAVRLIIERNLYGLDIDDRAAQLAYFTVMMKARQYDRRFLARKNADGEPDVPQPHVLPICESNGIDRSALADFINGDARLKKAMDSIMKEMTDAKEYGSILNITPVDFDALYARFDEVHDEFTLSRDTILTTILPLVQVAQMLSQKYDVVVTNPPYMSTGNMSSKLANKIKKDYSIAKNDIYSAFLVRCRALTKQSSFYSMITMQGWMFTQRFEDLRYHLLYDTLCSMVHIGYNTFPDLNSKIAQGTSFVFRKSHINNYLSMYFDLTNRTPQNADKHLEFVAKLSCCDSILIANSKFTKLPGYQFAYWITPPLLRAFEYGQKLGDISKPRQGLATGDNDYFLRFWFEVPFFKIGFGYSSTEMFHQSGMLYAPYNKGGEYCKWFGNRDIVIKFNDYYYDLLQNQGNHLPSKQHYFDKCATWSALTTSSFSCRHCEYGFVFDTKGSSLFCDDDDNLLAYMGFLNSIVANEIFKMLSPTVDYNAGTVANVPVIPDKQDDIIPIVKENIAITSGASTPSSIVDYCRRRECI